MIAVAARYGLAALITAGLIAGIYMMGRNDGIDDERARITAEIERARKERERVEGDVRRLPDDELWDRLLKPAR